MLDALYSWFIDRSGVSTINAALLGFIFLLARQRYKGMLEDFEAYEKRIVRLERTFLINGYNLYEEE